MPQRFIEVNGAAIGMCLISITFSERSAFDYELFEDDHACNPHMRLPLGPSKG